MRTILIKTKANVLSTVIILSVLMLLAVLAIIMIWDADFVLFSRMRYLRMQEDNIRSALVLYCAHPEMFERLPETNIMRLYTCGPSSEMIISRKSWGLYEILTISSLCGRVKRTRVVGLEAPQAGNLGLWYRNKNSSLTLTGRTTIEGTVFLPDERVVYGQMQSVYFSGTKLDGINIGNSDEEMPEPVDATHASLRDIFAADRLQKPYVPVSDSTVNSFASNALVIPLGDTILSGGYFCGNIILKGGNIRIDSTATLNNVIIAADRIVIGQGCVGRAQLFARDTIIVENRAVLKYPSGCYCEGYGKMEEYCEINGYFIVDNKPEYDLEHANFEKSITSVLRGMLYVRGNSHVQGIISGCAFVDEAIIYTPYGNFRNTISDLVILTNKQIAYPLWFDAAGRRKEAVWVD